VVYIRGIEIVYTVIDRVSHHLRCPWLIDIAVGILGKPHTTKPEDR
jgi:hypothetical protein